jgi:hypothetical protein
MVGDRDFTTWLRGDISKPTSRIPLGTQMAIGVKEGPTAVHHAAYDCIAMIPSNMRSEYVFFEADIKNQFPTPDRKEAAKAMMELPESVKSAALWLSAHFLTEDHTLLFRGVERKPSHYKFEAKLNTGFHIGGTASPVLAAITTRSILHSLAREFEHKLRLL